MWCRVCRSVSLPLLSGRGLSTALDASGASLPPRLALRDERKRVSRGAALAGATPSLPSFDAMLSLRGLPPLARAPVTTVMVNVGKLCNLACRHCHVEAGPARTVENMGARAAARLLALLEASPGLTTLDVTGGAPELNPHFRSLVAGARALGLAVISRCNLSVLLLPGQEGTPAFLAAHGVRVIASLPATTAPVVDRQRGAGVWADSLRGLALLGAQGYGARPELALDLIYNPAGARLPPPQEEVEAQFREALLRDHGLRFNRLLTLANMPVKRFADDLQRSGEYEAYMGLLATTFNPDAVPALMCRSTVSVAWDGSLFDCDFNQALAVPLPPCRGAAAGAPPPTIFTVESFTREGATPVPAGARIATTKACFGCTAGSGSSCGGALAKAAPASPPA